MSKKIYLSLCFVCLGLLSQAQITSYEYPSENLTEKSIAEILDRSKQEGISDAEFATFSKLLHNKMLKEQQEYLLGSSAKNGNPIVNTSSCVNPGFENTTNSNWNFASGNINGVTLPCNTCPTGSSAINNVVNSSSTVAGVCSGGLDTYGSFPVVAPGSNYSLLLNDASTGGKIMKASYSFVVSLTSNIYTFQYAVVLNSGGHPVANQPYFHVDVKDNTTGLVIACTQFNQSVPTSGSIPGWQTSPTLGGSSPNTVNYKPWTTVSLDLTSIVGNTVTVEYIISDCANGGHFGYVYIDGDCNQVATTSNAGICSGNNANLCGPPGYSNYAWTGPATGSSQCLSTSTAGNYTLNMTSSTSCPAPQLTYSVSVAPAPTASISTATTPCSLVISSTDLSSISSGSLTNWEWNWGDGQTSSSTTAGSTQAHTYSAQGTYNIVMTCTTSAGCVSTTTVPITLSGSLTAPVTTASATCNGSATGSATVSPTGGSGTYSYTYTPAAGSSAIATGLAAGAYSVAINDGAGCNGVSTFTVTQPTALNSTSTTVQSTCANFNGSASVSMSGGTGPYTYTWTSGGGNTSTISGVAPGNYTCNVTDFNGCSYSAPVTITNQPLPTITSITTSSVTCYNGTNGSATVVATGTGLSYNWSPSGSSSAIANGLSSGPYTVTVTDGNNCVVTGTDTIIQATDIVSSSSVTGSSCGGATGSATVTPAGGTGTYSYAWSPSGGNTNIATTLAAGNYNCTITDGNSCIKTIPVFISTTTGPTVTVVASASVICNGGNDGAAGITLVSGGTGPLTYTWLPPAVSTTNTVSNLPAGTYSVAVRDSLGCLGSGTVTINQPAVISAPVVTTSVSCNGGSNGAATINTSGGTGPYSYTWAPSGGNNGTATGLSFGTYTVIILDAHNCPTATIANIAQPTPLSATASSTSVSCNGGNNGTAAVVPSGGVGPYGYSWSPFGGSNASAINLTFGNYVTTITDANLCTYTVSSSVSEPPAITATVTSTNIDCNGKHDGSATVTATGGTGAYTYSWSPSAGTSSVTPNTLNPGSYTNTVKDANGCYTKTTFTITQPALIVISNPTVTPVKCSGATNGTAQVNVTGGITPYTYNWIPSSATNTLSTVTGLGAGAYTVIVTDANGCPKTKKVTIGSPEPKDTLDITASLCSTDPNVVLNAPSGTGINPPYQWYNNSAAITGETSVSYTAIQELVNDYYVTWSHNGCAYVTTKVLETVQADLSTYPQTNIFTPNGDRINDDFYPFAPIATAAVSTSFVSGVNAMLKEYSLLVYDRWGKLIYNTSSYNTPWDGKHAGKDVPDGTYFWIVNYKSNCNNNKGIQKIKGFVQVLR